MGLYATLTEASVHCPVCGGNCTGDWQFYFGAVTTLPEYRLGASVTWDDTQAFGLPSMKVVRAIAFSASEPACTHCGADTILAELLIEDSVLVSLANPIIRAHTRELLYEGEARVPRFHADLYRVRGELDTPQP